MSQMQQNVLELTDAELKQHTDQMRTMIEEMEQLEGKLLSPEQEQKRQQVYGNALDVLMLLRMEHINRLLAHIKATLQDYAAEATLEKQLAASNQLAAEREQQQGEGEQ